MKMNYQMKSLIAALTLGAAVITGAMADIKVGDSFPALSAFSLQGKAPSTKGKVVLVDVFASWCKPCKEAFPVIDEMHQTYGAKGLAVVAVSVDENAKDYAKFVAKQKPGFATLLDSEHKFAKVVNPPSMPTSYIIDKKGKVRFLHKGFKGKKTRAAYIKEIEALLRE
jgi:thiol-disulfide isomerase/thioredoxin